MLILLANEFCLLNWLVGGCGESASVARGAALLVDQHLVLKIVAEALHLVAKLA
jgi:hypothetical protein